MKRLRTLAAVAVPMMLVAACGSDTDSDATSDTTAAAAATNEAADEAAEDTAADGGDAAAEAMSTTYPFTFTNCGFTQTIEAPPERIIANYDTADPLVLFGLADKIVGWHTYQPLTRFPGLQPELDKLEVSGDPFADEAVIALKPDLVVAGSAAIFTDEYGLSREDLAEIGAISWVPESLCAQDIADPPADQAVALSNRTFDDVLAEVATLGEIVDRQAEAQDLIETLSAEMALLEGVVEGREPVKVSVFSYWDGTLGGVYVGGVGEDYIVRAGGVNPHRDPEAQFKSLSVEELTVTPLDVVLVDSDAPDTAQAVLDLFPTWPAAETGRAAFVAGLFSDISAPYVVRDLIELFHPDVELP